MATIDGLPDLSRLVDELRLRALHLEVENDELRRGGLELELALDRHTDVWESLPSGVCIVDADGGRIERLNAAAVLLLGAHVEAGSSLEQVVGFDRARALRRQLADVPAPPARLVADLELGGASPRTLQLVMQRLPGGAPARIVVLLTDVSERKRTIDVLQFLADSGHKLRGGDDPNAIAAAAVRLAVPFLADFAVIDLLDPQRGWYRAAACHRDAERQSFLDAPSEPSYAMDPRIRAATVRALADGAALYVPDVESDGDEVVIRRRRRTPLDRLGVRSVLVVPLASPGRNHGILLLGQSEPGRDLRGEAKLAETYGHRVAAAVASAALHAQLVESNRVKDEFLARVSHELRTPTATVLMWLQALRSSLDDRAGAERAIEAVERAARMQARMVEDLVDLARGMAGKLGLLFRRVRLVETLEHALDTLEHERRAKELRVDIDGRSLELEVWADPQRLAQVWSNLLQNAYKFSDPGGRVRVVVRADRDQARISVVDEGAGIEADLLPSVFELFRQGQDGPGGLGIGLAVVQQLVVLHGGTVEVQSDGPGRGATLTVTLPIFVEEQPRAVESVRLDGVAVLLVGAAGAPRAHHERLFLELGALVSTSDGHDLAAAGARAAPDVVICDLASLGDGALGRTTAFRDAATGSRVALIALEDGESALGAGFDAVVPAVTSDLELAKLVGRLARG